MKTLFAIAFIASAFTFVGCGAKPADTTNAATTTTTGSTTATPAPAPAPAAELSLVDRVADCTCEMVNTAVALKKEIDAAPEDKKAELTAKAAEAMKEPACMAGLEEEAKKVPEADQAKMEADLKAAMEKKCGAAMKEMGGM
jgi:hypothetical protein